jgi:hypothetical protein
MGEINSPSVTMWVSLEEYRVFHHWFSGVKPP